MRAVVNVLWGLVAIPVLLAGSVPQAEGSPKPGSKASRRNEILSQRAVRIEKMASEAKREMHRAQQEKQTQARYRKIELLHSRKAEDLKRRADGLLGEAEAHRRKAEEARKQAEASWARYQAPKGGQEPKPKKPIETPKAELPKSEPPKSDLPNPVEGAEEPPKG